MADGDGVRRTYIVRTAAGLFSSHGYTSTSIREVAAAVGLSKPGLYHYFPTKEAILEEIAEGAIESLLAHLERAMVTPGRTVDRLRELVVGRVEVIGENHDALKVFWQERARLGPEANARLNRRMHHYHEEAISLIRDGQAEGVVRRDLDPQMAMLGLLGMTGWAYLWFKPTGRLTAREIGEHFWSLMSAGLLADGQAPEGAP